MKTLPFSLCAGLLLAGLAPQSQAEIVLSTNFDAGYTQGDLTGQSSASDVGFSGAFQATGNEYGGVNPTQTVVAGGLNYSNGNVFISGGTQSVQVADPNNPFTQQQSLIRSISASLSGQTLYFRAVINAPGVDDLLLGFGNNNGDLGNAGIGATDTNSGNGGTAGGQFGNGAKADSGVNLAAGNNLLVAEFVYDSSTGTYNTVNFFLNPSSTIQGTPTATFSEPAGTDGPTSFGSTLSMLTTNSVGPYGIDSIAVGTTYSDVVPEPGTWALVGLSGIITVAYLLRRRQIA